MTGPAVSAGGPVGDKTQFLALINSLSDTYRPEGVLIWLQSPNRHFDGKTPLEVLRDEGWQPLLDEADQLAGGPASDVTREPTGGQELRDTIRIHHPIMRSETGPFSGCRCGQVRLGQDVIAHVVTELRAALAGLTADAERVRNVRELHTRDSTVPYACEYCGQSWPCDVIHALDTVLEGEHQP